MLLNEGDPREWTGGTAGRLVSSWEGQSNEGDKERQKQEQPWAHQTDRVHCRKYSSLVLL